MVSFDKKRCEVKTVYCGNGSPTKKHSRKGTQYECLKKGFGSGLWSEKTKHLSKNSLQRIPYVNGTIEIRLSSYGIKTMTQLKLFMRRLDMEEKREFLYDMCMDKGVMDFKAYNSILLFLFDNSVQKLPSCQQIIE